MLQEYSSRSGGSSATRHNIFTGTSIGFTEAPHLYKRDGWYYLMTAEGGTGWGHAVTMARSRALIGPYELHPDVHVLTARVIVPTSPLQRAGHADLVETPDGETYMVYLCGRPLAEPRPLHARPRDGDSEDGVGRRRLAARDGRRRRADARRGRRPASPPHPSPAAPVREDFDGPRCRSTSSGCDRHGPTSCSASRRVPGTCGCTVARRSAASSRRRSSRAGSRRIASARRRCVEFEPEHFQQMAGLVCYYNSAKFHYLYVSHDEQAGSTCA